MSKLEMCSECHKYKSNLNDEGICAECEGTLRNELKRAVDLKKIRICSSWPIRD